MAFLGEAMSKKEIRTGNQIIDEFLTAMKSHSSIDEDVLQAVRLLRMDDKLTERRLQQELEEIRNRRLGRDQA